MFPFPYTVSQPRFPYRDRQVPSPRPGSGEHCSQRSFYRSSGQGDVFLFSPSVCSRDSKDSTSQSSGSFDTLSYYCSPSVADLHSASALKPLSPPNPPFLGSLFSRSPLFVEAYLSGDEPKPITRSLDPDTSFQELFHSSPAGYWQADDLSDSPISRRSSAGGDHVVVVDSEDEGEDKGNQETTFNSKGKGKIESLLEYGQSRDIPDTPPSRLPCAASSPSSLSSLSSIASSPSALFFGLPAPSSQTSRGRTPFGSPSTTASATYRIFSPLGSPFKLPSASPKRLGPAFGRSAGRDQGFQSLATGRLRPVRRSIAAEILNRLDRPIGHNISPSPLRIASSPMRQAVHDADSDSDDENYEPIPGPKQKQAKRARIATKSTHGSPSGHRKRARTSGVASALLSSAVRMSEQDGSRQAAGTGGEEEDGINSPTYPNRTFPLRIPVNENFPLFYRRFPVSSALNPALAVRNGITALTIPDASANAPRDEFDLYTPRFVKGKGTSKVGLCPICHESETRGGEGKKLWLSMKFSAFKCYHMQYAHGISATTGLPFSPPIAFQTVVRSNPGKHEKTHLMEGKCHKCKKWVPVEGIKDVPSKVKEIFWWKHAAACHQGSTIEGEGDIFMEDEVYRAVKSAVESDDQGEDDEDEDDEVD